MTLTATSAAASFTPMKSYLSKCRGRLGIPLDYVVRAQLKGPMDAPEDGPEDPPAFGYPDSPYETIDAEMTARAAILNPNMTHAQLARPLDDLEAHGPFTPTFIQDAVKVFDIPRKSYGWADQEWVQGLQDPACSTLGRPAAGSVRLGHHDQTPVTPF